MLRHLASKSAQQYGKVHRGTLGVAIVATVILAALLITPLISLFEAPALLGLDATGGHVQLEVPVGTPELWWGPFATADDPACARGVQVSLSGGTLDVTRGTGGVELAFGARDRLAWRCYGAEDLQGQSPPRSNLIVSEATLPFAGHVTVGDQASFANAMFGPTPPDAEGVRRQIEPFPLDEGSAWARVPDGGEKELRLHPGDQITFERRPDTFSDYGLLVIQGGRLRTVAWTRGQGVAVARWGQGFAARELVAPNALDRLQSAPIWVIITLASGLAIAVFSIWATHMSTKALFEQAERHHSGERG